MDLPELYERFRRSHLDHSPETQKIYLSAVLKFTDSVSKPIDEITEDDVDRWKADMLAAGIARTSINMWIRALVSICAWGGRRELATRQFVGLKDQLMTPEDPPTYLSRDEFDRLLQHVHNPSMQALFVMLAYTGLSVGEALRVRWQDISGDLLTVRAGKSGRFRSLPLHSVVLDRI
jgi:integrase